MRKNGIEIRYSLYNCLNCLSFFCLNCFSLSLYLSLSLYQTIFLSLTLFSLSLSLYYTHTHTFFILIYLFLQFLSTFPLSPSRTPSRLPNVKAVLLNKRDPSQYIDQLLIVGRGPKQTSPDPNLDSSSLKLLVNELLKVRIIM